MTGNGFSPSSMSRHRAASCLLDPHHSALCGPSPCLLVPRSPCPPLPQLPSCPIAQLPGFHPALGSSFIIPQSALHIPHSAPSCPLPAASCQLLLTALGSRLPARSSRAKRSPLGSRLSALHSRSHRFPLTRSPAVAYKDLARQEIEMASPAENPKAFCGEASRHTCTASSVHYNLDRSKFSVPTGHHSGKRWPHAAHYLISCFKTNVPQYQYVPQYFSCRVCRPLSVALGGPCSDLRHDCRQFGSQTRLVRHQQASSPRAARKLPSRITSRLAPCAELVKKQSCKSCDLIWAGGPLSSKLVVIINFFLY